jgi:hypothetical protein
MGLTLYIIFKTNWGNFPIFRKPSVLPKKVGPALKWSAKNIA